SQDLRWIAQVLVDVGGAPLRGAGQQCPRVGEHDRVIVHVDHSRLWRYRLCDLVHVVRAWQAGTDVKELPDTRVVDQVPDGTTEKGAVLAHRGAHSPPALHGFFRGLPIGRVVVLAAEVVVVDPGRVRFRRVDDRLHRLPPEG